MPEFDILLGQLLSVRALGSKRFGKRFFEKVSHLVAKGLLFCSKRQVHIRTAWLINRRALYSEFVESSEITPHGGGGHDHE